MLLLRLQVNKPQSVQTGQRVTERNINSAITLLDGARGSVVVKALCYSYKPEGRGFDTR
jgi:hypothetical protein